MDDTLGLEMDTSNPQATLLTWCHDFYSEYFFLFELKVIWEFLIKINFRLTEKSSFTSFCLELFSKTMEQWHNFMLFALSGTHQLFGVAQKMAKKQNEK